MTQFSLDLSASSANAIASKMAAATDGEPETDKAPSPLSELSAIVGEEDWPVVEALIDDVTDFVYDQIAEAFMAWMGDKRILDLTGVDTVEGFKFALLGMVDALHSKR